jgi:hypothetical protein
LIAEKLINFTEDEEQQYEEQSDPEETFVKPKNPPRRVTRKKNTDNHGHNVYICKSHRCHQKCYTQNLASNYHEVN